MNDLQTKLDKALRAIPQWELTLDNWWQYHSHYRNHDAVVRDRAEMSANRENYTDEMSQLWNSVAEYQYDLSIMYGYLWEKDREETEARRAYWKEHYTKYPKVNMVRWKNTYYRPENLPAEAKSFN